LNEKELGLNVIGKIALRRHGADRRIILILKLNKLYMRA
jgi:hypothetical protein